MTEAEIYISNTAKVLSIRVVEITLSDLYSTFYVF